MRFVLKSFRVEKGYGRKRFHFTGFTTGELFERTEVKKN